MRNEYAHQIYLTYNDISDEPQDGDHVSDHIAGAVKLAKSQYNTEVFSINTDNDSTMKTAVRKANTKLQREHMISDDLWKTTCYSRAANLLLGAVGPENSQSSLREIVSAFSSLRIS